MGADEPGESSPARPEKPRSSLPPEATATTLAPTHELPQEKRGKALKERNIVLDAQSRRNAKGKRILYFSKESAAGLD